MREVLKMDQGISQFMVATLFATSEANVAGMGRSFRHPWTWHKTSTASKLRPVHWPLSENNHSSEFNSVLPKRVDKRINLRCHLILNILPLMCLLLEHDANLLFLRHVFIDRGH